LVANAPGQRSGEHGDSEKNEQREQFLRLRDRERVDRLDEEEVVGGELRRTVAALRNEIARLKGGLVGRTVKANVMRHGKGERAGTDGAAGQAPAGRHARKAS
jgi:hypothetical protein